MESSENTPTVSIDHLGTLLLRGHIIEAADTIPENLQLLVASHETIIKNKMLSIFKNELFSDRETRDSLSPSILVARVALLDSPLDALTKEAVEADASIYMKDIALNEIYRQFWVSLNETAFLPEVRRLKFPLDRAGIWLSIRGPADLT
jgi:hypothetical protein